MLRIIFDTDMGVDCDDAAALAILGCRERRGEISVRAITTATTREGATATVKAICDHYGMNPPIGKMALPAIPCDAENRYAKAVKDHYGIADIETDAVKLLRQTLAAEEPGVVVIAVGPLSNFARLLKSGADEYSPLDGAALLREKVSMIYIMGGSFEQNYPMFDHNQYPKFPYPEWNFGQDLDSARYFCDHCPVPTLYVPSEAAKGVYTDIRENDSPVWYSFKAFAIAHGWEPKGFHRDSWDPLTCLVAFGELHDCYDISAPGTVHVTEDGISYFVEGEGNARILLLRENYHDIGPIINREIED